MRSSHCILTVVCIVLSLTAVGIACAQDVRFDDRPSLATAATLGSLALADLDGDGDADVLATDAAGGRIVWIENNGDVDPGFTIEHVVATPVVSPRVVAAGDLDGDGDLDIAAAGSASSGQVLWFENLGGVPPEFTARTVGMRPNLEATGVVRSVTLADLEADGDLDIVCGFLLPNGAASGHVTVYLNDGAAIPSFARFQLPSPSAALHEITGTSVDDFNNDGQPDIVASSRDPNVAADADSLVVWQNTGSSIPGFLPSVVANGLGDPAAVVVATLTSDALPDIAVALEQTNRVLVFANDQTSPGTFLAPQPLIAQGVADIAAGDLVGGPKVDLIAATISGPVLFENAGGAVPAFGTSQIVSPDGAITAVAIGMLDADSDVDAVSAGPFGARWFERVEPIENLTSGSVHASLDDALAAIVAGDTLRASTEHFVPDVVLAATAAPYDLESTGPLTIGPRASVEVAADVAFRSAPGEAVTLSGEAAIEPGASLTLDSSEAITIDAGQTLDDSVLIGASSPIRLKFRPAWGTEELDGAFAAASSPFSGEPRDARFFRPSTAGPAAVVTVSELIGGGSALPGSLAVYSQDALSPTGWTAIPVDDAEEGTHQSIATGDLDRDGDDDLTSVFVPASGAPSILRLHLSDGADPPSFATFLVGSVQASGGHVVFDLDRDGLADIVTPTGFYKQLNQQSFAFLPFPVVSGDRGIGVAIARLNADFEPDVVVHTAMLTGMPPRATGFRLVALEADGMGGFVPTVIDALDRSGDPACVGDCYPERNVAITNLNTLTVADLDRDGDDDVILSEDQGLAVYNNAGGGFATALMESDLPWAESVATDANGDGALDLVVASTTKSAVLAIDNPILGSGARSELIRPFDRAAAIDAADVDGDDDTDLVVAGSAFDRVTLLRRGRLEGIEINGVGSRLRADSVIELAQGHIKLNGGELDSAGDLLIRPAGVVTGQGSILGSVFNGGLIETRPAIAIAADYAQFDAFDQSVTGSLDVLLPTASPDPLQVGGAAALAGDLRVGALQGVQIGPAPRRLVTAQVFDPTLNQFTTTLVPRLGVVLGGGQLEAGVGVVTYGQGPGQAFAELAPRPFNEPPIMRSDFASLGIPADAVVGDVAGGPNGGPDGIPDLVIAYPVLAGGENGGVALLVGEHTERGCTFRPVGVYQGKNADGPIAVEIGDFNGDGDPEIAFGNRRDTSLANVVSFLDVDSSAQSPLTDSAITPLPLPRDRRITDLAVITLVDVSLRRGPPAPETLLTLSSGGVAGTVTASTFETATNDWEVCDIDVCEDPDSFDPIDPDGAALLLGQGFTSSSTADDKVLVASNTGGMPDSFPKESFASGSNPTEIRAADLNNDGFPDIAAINETAGTVSVFVNIADAGGPGGRAFDDDGVEWTLRSDPDDPDPLPSSIALADLDDDGDLDVAVVSTDDAGARAVRSLTNLFVETASLSFTLPESLPTQPADTPVIVREFDVEGTGGAVVLNDDLVVLTEPAGGALAQAGRGHVGMSSENSILCSESDMCLPDTNGDGLLTPADFNAWIIAFNAGLPAADQNGDGLVTPADFNAWIINYNAGC